MDGLVDTWREGGTREGGGGRKDGSMMVMQCNI